MMSTNKLPGENFTCPYWSDSTRSCLIHKQGLYVPISEHNATYCQTENHPFCPRFEKYGTDWFEGEIGSEKVSDRRQYTRIVGSFPLRITELRKNSDFGSLPEIMTTTVDLSFGGIRLQSQREFTASTIVSFSLNDDSGPPVQGIGMVAWCRSLGVSVGYQAGMTFTDGSTSGSVRRLIGGGMVGKNQSSCC